MSNRLVVPIHLILTGIVAFAACGSADVAATSPPADVEASSPADMEPHPPAIMADAYARGLSDWEGTTDDVMITGGLAGAECSHVRSGRESERHPACIYRVAYEGCHDGITGERLRGWDRPIEKEHADEPRLLEIYHQAVQDCRNSN